MYYVSMPNKNAAFLKKLVDLMNAQDPPWSNADLARATGLSEGAITNFFKGVRTPSRESIKKIAKVFGVASAWLRTRFVLIVAGNDVRAVRVK